MDTVFEEKDSWTAGEQFCTVGTPTTEVPSTDQGKHKSCIRIRILRYILSECKTGFTAKPSRQRFKGIETWEDCRDKCNQEECTHFSFKVIKG